MKFKENSNMELPATMKAVVFDGPHKVSLQDRPVPASMLTDSQTSLETCLG